MFACDVVVSDGAATDAISNGDTADAVNVSTPDIAVSDGATANVVNVAAPNVALLTVLLLMQLMCLLLMMLLFLIMLLLIAVAAVAVVADPIAAVVSDNVATAAASAKGDDVVFVGLLLRLLNQSPRETEESGSPTGFNKRYYTPLMLCHCL